MFDHCTFDSANTSSGETGTSSQPVSSSSSLHAAAWKSSPGSTPPPGVVQCFPLGGGSS